MQPPKRPYEMIVVIGADDLNSLAHSLKNIAFDVWTMTEKGHQNPHVTTSGSPSTGYNFSLVRTDTADHHEYFKKLDEYLKESRAAKETELHDGKF